jgi:cbb3-type cytochrome oxidase subunit 3
VTLDVSEHTPLLRIVERDDGNTWEHSAGGALISTPGEHTVRLGVSSSTILPADSATLTVPVAGTSKGTHPTEVILWYAHDKRKAIWRGMLDYPNSIRPAKTTGTVIVHGSNIPTWIIILAVVLGLIVLLLLLLLLLLFALLRKRRKENDNETARQSPQHEAASSSPIE